MLLQLHFNGRYAKNQVKVFPKSSVQKNKYWKICIKNPKIEEISKKYGRKQKKRQFFLFKIDKTAPFSFGFSNFPVC